MPTIEHSVLTTTELHEPKDVSTASSGEVYVADGLGSGSWEPSDNNTSHGSIYSVDSDAVSIGSIGTTSQKFAGFASNGPSLNTTPDASNDQITIGSAGNYFINFTTSFATTATGDAGTYEFRVRVNGVESVIGLKRAMSGSSDTGSATGSGILTLALNDVITVYVESDDGGNSDDIDIEFCSLSVFKVGS